MTNAIGCADLPDFSAEVLALGQMARMQPVTEFLGNAVARVGTCIGHHGAWWGLCVDRGSDQIPEIQQAEVIGLPETTTTDWRKVGAKDPFARAAVGHPGQVQRVERMSSQGWPAAVAGFAKRLGIEHGMALCLGESASGQMFFLALYRGSDGEAFTRADETIFRELVRHVAQLWQYSLQDALCRAASDEIDGMALASRDGRLHYAGTQIFELLYRSWPKWDGLVLPAPLVAQLAKAPCTIRLQKEHVSVSLIGDQWHLVRVSGDASHRFLTPRERRVAHLFAQGMTYKEIARQVSLTPATVRTYLRNAYSSLGVKNKVELATALASRTGR